MVILVFSIPKQAVANLKFDVEGLDGALQENVEIYLDAIPPNERTLSFRFKSRVKDEISKALQALGYYHPKITYSLEHIISDTDATVSLKIDPGPVVMIKDVDIKIKGEARDDPAFDNLLKTSIKKGDPLNQGQYDALKLSIQNLALRRGYFDARYTESQLKVVPKLNEAFIVLDFDSGKRASFGKVTYTNSQIEESRLDSMLTFDQKTPYLVSDLGAFNQALSNTGWFSSVLVETGIKEIDDNQVPIHVFLEPAPRNRFETGIGYSTDTRARLKVGWDKPWFNSAGHSLNTDLYISAPQNKLETTYQIPLQDVLRDFYQVRLGLEKLDNHDTKSLELTASLARHWKYESGWQRILYLRWLYSNFDVADISDRSNLILPGINLSRIRTRGGAMPSWGDKQSITFEVANKMWESDIDLYRLITETVWIRSLNDNNRVITRANAGAVVTDEFERVPPSLRFFVGGDNSVRGYAYKSISPRDTQGQLEGGSYMTTGSLEYNHRIKNNWWGAAFVDVGDAWTANKPEWKTSVGVGVRWVSPVGPVRFDIAHGIENQDDDVMFHFSMGPLL